MTKLDRTATYRVMDGLAKLAAISGLLATAGCVNVSAPDKPIEINLNIRVTQEVIYRLEDSTKALIQQNPGIF